jgi:hypothetical protein
MLQIQQQHEQKGLPGAVGTTAKGIIPFAICVPLHAVGNATQALMQGARALPQQQDSGKEEEEQWKTKK